jgi:CheY-like chemotaxis protein
MSKTILFVEDDEDDRDVLADVLQDVNPSVNAVFAENGLKALEYLSKKKEASQLPCLIVLDLNMPFLDGKETFIKIRNELQLNSVPVIIFTSSHSPTDKQLFTSQGVEYIIKPNEFANLNKVVGHMVSICNSGNC